MAFDGPAPCAPLADSALCSCVLDSSLALSRERCARTYIPVCTECPNSRCVCVCAVPRAVPRVCLCVLCVWGVGAIVEQRKARIRKRNREAERKIFRMWWLISSS